jgi:hypothetical protein
MHESRIAIAITAPTSAIVVLCWGRRHVEGAMPLSLATPPSAGSNRWCSIRRVKVRAKRRWRRSASSAATLGWLFSGESSGSIQTQALSSRRWKRSAVLVEIASRGASAESRQDAIEADAIAQIARH